MTRTTLPVAWVSSGELAAALGVTRTTIRRYEGAGKIPRANITPGGHRRWRREDVQDLLEGQRAQQKAGA